MATDSAHLADCFLAGDLQALGKGVTEASALRALDDVGFDICQALTARGEIEAAVNFVVSFCHWQDDPDDWIARFARRIHDEGEKAVAANLLMYLIQKDKGDAFAYEACVAHCLDGELNDHALALFAQGRKRHGIAASSIRNQFNVAALMQSCGDFEQAFALYDAILAADPDFAPAKANVLHLARSANHQPAIDWIEEFSGRIAAEAPTLADGEVATPHLVVWRGAESAEIADAIRANGFCYVKGGCAPDVAEEIRQLGMQLQDAGTVFPVSLDEEVFAKLDRLFLFDPKAVLSLLSASDYRIDRPLSAMRRVSAEKTASATPFHQDSTAFQRALYNVWAPLTPAGGEYPSIQFVAKLINVAEQTKIAEGEYNRIEIDKDFVVAKYGHLLRVIEDAAPGDCVMFYGTTIHRSYGMERASQARFNIEVRWS